VRAATAGAGGVQGTSPRWPRPPFVSAYDDRGFISRAWSFRRGAGIGPACGRRCKHLYLDELACRICGGLDYASRHLHRTVAGLHRIRRLRRRIGVDQRPFASMPWPPRHHTRFHRIAAEIRTLERGLVGHLGGINQDLERRARLRVMIPK
jgi:hypothetical protein